MNDIKKICLHEVEVHKQTSQKIKQTFQVMNTLPGLTLEQVERYSPYQAKIDIFFPMATDFEVMFARLEIDGGS